MLEIPLSIIINNLEKYWEDITISYPEISLYSTELKEDPEIRVYTAPVITGGLDELICDIEDIKIGLILLVSVLTPAVTSKILKDYPQAGIIGSLSVYHEALDFGNMDVNVIMPTIYYVTGQIATINSPKDPGAFIDKTLAYLELPINIQRYVSNTIQIEPPVIH